MDPFYGKLTILLVCGFFSLVACAFSSFSIFQHLRNYTQPVHQRHIVRILVIVPVYAVYSWFALLFYPYQVYFSILRDCYESYALYQFFALCVSYAGGEEALAGHMSTLDRLRLSIPLCCARVQPGARLLLWTRRLVLQYVIVKPIIGVISIILEAVGVLHEGSFQPDGGFLYLLIVNNTCLTMALYALVVFYRAAKHALTPYKPVLKFVCIKIVLFLTFWQGVLISVLGAAGVIPELWGMTSAEVAVCIQNAVICVEMAGVSILHLWAFPHDIYRVSSQSEAPLTHETAVGKQSVAKAAVGALSQKDMVDDTVTAFGRKKRTNDKYRKLREDRLTEGPHVPSSTSVAMSRLDHRDPDLTYPLDSSDTRRSSASDDDHQLRSSSSNLSHSTATNTDDLDELELALDHRDLQDQVRIDFGHDEDEFRLPDDDSHQLSLAAHDHLDNVRYDSVSTKHRRR